MGSNRRYADRFDQQVARRVAEAAVKLEPVTLSEQELDVQRHPVRTGPAVPVKAWVRYHESAVPTQAVAYEWTDRAMHLRWTMADGTERDAWVWANAVERV